MLSEFSLQGILLPGLGTFSVGPVLEDRFQEMKRVRATFSLLDARFPGISQERGKWALASKLQATKINFWVAAKLV